MSLLEIPRRSGNSKFSFQGKLKWEPFDAADFEIEWKRQFRICTEVSKILNVD